MVLLLLVEGNSILELQQFYNHPYHRSIAFSQSHPENFTLEKKESVQLQDSNLR